MKDELIFIFSIVGYIGLGAFLLKSLMSIDGLKLTRSQLAAIVLVTMAIAIGGSAGFVYLYIT